MLHIINGESTANILKQTDLPGDLLPWREALVCGPTPGGLSLEDWINTRAEHLSQAYGSSEEESKDSLQNLEEVLRTYSKHDEVTLWFEHDLFCQINLIYLLNFFAQQAETETKLSFICIGDFPGIKNFRGLGQLSPFQLSSLFEQRENITSKMLELGGEAWRAFSSPAPTEIEKFLLKESSELSFLKDALKAHLARFPSVKNGLGRVEEIALNLIENGIDEFKPLFEMFGELEPVYGFGDSQFWHCLKYLSQLKKPLLQIRSVQVTDAILLDEQAKHIDFEITKRGHAILSGSEQLNEIDFWLGGVHLNGETNLWRWDEQNQRIVKN